MVRASQNTILAELYEAGLALFFRKPAFWRVFTRAPEQRHRVGSGYEGHLQIYDAVARQDAGLAREQMRRHLEQVEQSLLAVMHETLGTAEDLPREPSPTEETEREAMRQGYRVIDADTHVTPSVEVARRLRRPRAEGPS